MPSRPRRRGKKSGRASTSDDIVTKDVDWPHFYVYRGRDCRPSKYEELSVEEFAFGYIESSTAKQVSQEHKATLLSHMSNLMQDAMNYSRPAARNFHGILLNQMEMGRLTWDDHVEIESLRRNYAHRDLEAVATSTTNKPKTTQRTVYCVAYQKGTCSHTEDDHLSPRGNVKHVCAFCLKARGREYPHPENECRGKKAKNDKGEA